MDCIFCKIIAGDIPCTKVYEDNHVFAFLDINPVYKGHTLVIPKVHCEDLHTMPKEVLGTWMEGVQKIADAVMKGVGVPGINLIMNNGKAAGQLVFHAHVHLVPRAEGSAFPSLPHTQYETEEDKVLAEKIHAEF